jgi:hypothetical protein
MKKVVDTLQVRTLGSYGATETEEPQVAEKRKGFRWKVRVLIRYAFFKVRQLQRRRNQQNLRE